MRYALLLYADVAAAQVASAEQAAAELDAYHAIAADLAAEGVLRGGEAFLPASAARRVQRDDGRVATGRVPTGALELSGFFLVECDEERAHEIAADLPVATHGQVEVRPLLDLDAPVSGAPGEPSAAGDTAAAVPTGSDIPRGRPPSTGRRTTRRSRRGAPKLVGAMLDRAVGAVVGGATGDALGAGYEFTTPSPDEPIVFKRGSMGFAPGEWTDDTAQAAAILRVTSTGRFDLEQIGAGFLAWFADGPRDVGNSTRAVLAAADGDPGRLRAAADDYFAAHPRGAAGNGSLMRTAPIAIAHLGDDEAIADAARAASHLTHGDPLAAEACVLWCIAIERAVVERRLDGVWDGLDLLAPVAAARWKGWLTEAETAPPASFRDNGFVVVALQAAHAAITQTPVPEDRACLHLQHALETAVRIGNDTDTVAAIAGQLLGARWGISAVPARWRRRLFGWPGWQVGELVRHTALTARGGSDDPDGWPSTPSMVPWGLRREPTPVCVAVPGVDRLLAGNLPGLEVALDQGVDAVLSLCRVGPEDVPEDVEHVETWLVDADGEDVNPNLPFVLDDAADALAALLDEGRRVYVHCVGGHSRTPTVVARHLSRTTARSWQAAFDDLRAVLPVHTNNASFTAVRRRDE